MAKTIEKITETDHPRLMVNVNLLSQRRLFSGEHHLGSS